MSQFSLATETIRECTCLACGHHVAVSFFNGGSKPLATLAWPLDRKAAMSVKTLPLDFVRCVECGHIYNVAFDYKAVPYSDRPNLMFNRGKLWSQFIHNLQSDMLDYLSSSPVVVEIGYGDGSFLSAFAQRVPKGRFIGFDPHGATTDGVNLELRSELFEPTVHLAELKPDLIVTRHVLEHLANPLGFLQKLAFAGGTAKLAPLLYLEVPCIDRLLETQRTVDLYYEHSSQFTSESFRKMLRRCRARVERIGHGYDGEVIYGFIRLESDTQWIEYAQAAEHYRQSTTQSLVTIQQQLHDLAKSEQHVAIWGGTGKSAAFMQRYAVSADKFPTVVDSDPAKVGTYVPGTGQKIRYRDWLLEHPVDTVIIPPQWRARDIVAEMQSIGIHPSTVLIEHQGKLINFITGDHPYGCLAI